MQPKNSCKQCAFGLPLIVKQLFGEVTFDFLSLWIWAVPADISMRNGQHFRIPFHISD